MDTIKEIDIEDKIKLITQELDIDFNKLEPRVIKHLMNIESSISRRESIFNQLADDAKNNKITLSSIAQDSGINSRQTIYNNDVLKNYINARISQANSLNPYNQIEFLKDQIKYLHNDLDAFVTSAIDTQILINENRALREDLKNLKQHKKTIEVQNSKMKTEIMTLKKNTTKTTSTHTSNKQSTVLSFTPNE